ncbi:MAG: leucine-rich repeat protein [Clostridia bacterium]|nr:leucine-rich repeat protein [Clostridia bacterium]
MKTLTKRLISFALAAVLVLSTFVFSVSASSAVIEVSVDKESCLQGEKVVATVYFPAAYDKAAALDMELTYDKSKIELVSLEKGVGLVNALESQQNGSVYSEGTKTAGKIVWSLAGSNNYEFRGVFAVVTFKVRQTAVNGQTNIDLKVKSASNSGYVDITSQVTAKGATIEIVRNSANDFVYKLNNDRTGYIITKYNCATVADLTVPSYYEGLPVVGIDSQVFYNHGELVNVHLPEHLTYIGDSAFYACTKLQSVYIPDTVESIGESAFFNCTSLMSIDLPLGLKEIKKSAFYSCYFIEEVEIPFCVTKIGNTAFYNCISLSKVKISKNTTSIGNGAFSMCNANKGVEFTTVEDNTYLKNLVATDYENSTIKIVKDLSLGEVSSVDAKVEYTGAPIAPAVSVTLDNGDSVAEGTDYKVVYVENVRIGTAKIYVVGTNGYGEGYVIDFEIFCEHASVNKTMSQKPTCTTDGVYKCRCNHCGYIFEEVIEAKGHPSGEWVYDKRPTYKATGIKHKVCSVCGKSYELNTVAEKVVPDVDLDGKVNSADALLILQTAVGKEVYIAPQGLFNADPNADSKINSSDALIALQMSVGLI